MRMVLLVVFLLSPAAGAQVYTWTDASGVKHFSSKAPPGQAHESVEIKDTNRSDAPSEDLSRTFERRATERKLEQAKSRKYSGPDYICTSARNSVKSARERWDSAKTQGYTQSQKQYHEQQIREAVRHRDNICR